MNSRAIVFIAKQVTYVGAFDQTAPRTSAKQYMRLMTE